MDILEFAFKLSFKVIYMLKGDIFHPTQIHIWYSPVLYNRTHNNMDLNMHGHVVAPKLFYNGILQRIEL